MNRLLRRLSRSPIAESILVCILLAGFTGLVAWLWTQLLLVLDQWVRG